LRLRCSEAFVRTEISSRYSSFLKVRRSIAVSDSGPRMYRADQGHRRGGSERQQRASFHPPPPPPPPPPLPLTPLLLAIHCRHSFSGPGMQWIRKLEWHSIRPLILQGSSTGCPARRGYACSAVDRTKYARRRFALSSIALTPFRLGGPTVRSMTGICAMALSPCLSDGRK